MSVFWHRNNSIAPILNKAWARGLFPVYSSSSSPEEKDKEPLVTTGPSIMNLSAAGFGVSSILVICKIKSLLKNVGLDLDVQIVK